MGRRAFSFESGRPRGPSLEGPRGRPLSVYVACVLRMLRQALWLRFLIKRSYQFASVTLL